MAKRMLVDATHPEETRVVVVSGTKLEDFDFESSTKKQLKGNIYLAKVVRIEPSLQAAFVEYGGNRHGFLAFNEIHPDYYQIPIADRERLIAEQQREPMSNGDLDDDVPPEGNLVDKSDIVDAREEREALAAARDVDLMDDGPSESLAVPPASEPEPILELPPAESDAPAIATDVIEHVAPQAGNEAGLPPPFETSLPADAASPGSTESASASVTPEAALPSLASAVVSDGMSVPSSGETPARIAAANNGDALLGPVADEDTAPDDRAGASDASHERDVSAARDTSADPTLDPSEAPQPPVTVETLGGDADIVEVRRPRRQPPSRHYKIQEVIKRRQIMLVQVVKEERGNKGAALTTYLSLAGRYCVLMPNAGRGGGISRKITSTADRKRMKEMLSELEVPKGMGVILRTAGLERSKPDIRRDYEYLLRLWDGIRELTMRSTAPALIYEESDLIKRSIRDLYNSDIDEILVEGENGYQRAHDFMRQLVPQHSRKVQIYGDRIPLFHRYQIENQLDAMHSPVVQLRTGAYIVINPTEALVAIDVNSGRSTKERNIEETALRTNIEAADEIARQVRLRDLSGLIVIDFIDMEDNRHQQQVERRLKEAMRSDRARIQIGRISPFGLLELSRQRLRPSLLENFTEVCRHCEGTGRVRSVESTALHVLRGIEDEGIRQRAGEVVASVPVAVALYILNHKRGALHEIEQRYGFHVVVEGTDELLAPHYRIERTRTRSNVQPESVAQTPLTASAIYQEFESEYEDESEAPAAAAETIEDTVAGDDAEGDDGARRGRRRRRRRRRRDGNEPESGAAVQDGDAEDESATDSDGEAPAEGEGEAPGEARTEDSEAAPAAGSAERAPGDDGDRRRRRRGRRGGRNRRFQDEGEDPGDWPLQIQPPVDAPDEPIDPAGEGEEEVPAVQTESGTEAVHAAETDADDSLAPAASISPPLAANNSEDVAPPAIVQTTAEPAPPKEDPAPAPAPSAGDDMPTQEEKPSAPIIPVILAEGPPPAPKKGWWSR